MSVRRVAIIGSRQRTDRETVTRLVRNLGPGVIVVSGGCEGPDQWAAEEARAIGLEVVEHLPDLSECRQRFEFTKRFYERNQRVVEDATEVFALVAPNRKGGTEDTIKRARKANVPVTII